MSNADVETYEEVGGREYEVPMLEHLHYGYIHADRRVFPCLPPASRRRQQAYDPFVRVRSFRLSSGSPRLHLALWEELNIFLLCHTLVE